MLKKRARLAVVAASAALVAFGCSSSLDPMEPEALNGKLAQGYVAGATVIADKLENGSTLGNYALDAGEVSTTSDEDGDFDLTVPAGYGDYVLYSFGGTIESTGLPASPMLAPKGAKHITPVTTLVALVPDLKSVIGDDYDADIADPKGVNGGLLQLAKSVEAVTTTLSNVNVGVLDSSESKIRSVGEIAKALRDEEGFNSLSDLEDKAILQSAVEKGVTQILDKNNGIISENVVVNDADAVTKSVTNVVTEIQEIPIDDPEFVEKDVEDKINTEIKTQITGKDEDGKPIEGGGIIDKVDSVSIKLGVVTLLEDGSETPIASISVADPDTGVYTETTIDQSDAEEIDAFSLALDPVNDFTTTKDFNGASLTLTLSDKDSSRTATIKVTNVDVSVTASGDLGFVFDDETKVLVDGTNSKGVKVQAMLENNDDDQAIVTYDAKMVTVDLENLNAAIEKQKPNSDLVDVGKVGDYTFSFTADDVPLQAGSGSFEVE